MNFKLQKASVLRFIKKTELSSNLKVGVQKRGEFKFEPKKWFLKANLNLFNLKSISNYFEFDL